MKGVTNLKLQGSVATRLIPSSVYVEGQNQSRESLYSIEGPREKEAADQSNCYSIKMLFK